jgi:hypothetical protein
MHIIMHDQLKHVEGNLWSVKRYNPWIAIKIIHDTRPLLPEGKNSRLDVFLAADFGNVRAQLLPVFHLVDGDSRICLGDGFKIEFSQHNQVLFC